MGDATTSGLAPRSDFALLGVVSGVFATDDRGVVVALLPPTLIAPPPETRTSRATDRGRRSESAAADIAGVEV